MYYVETKFTGLGKLYILKQYMYWNWIVIKIELTIRSLENSVTNSQIRVEGSQNEKQVVINYSTRIEY